MSTDSTNPVYVVRGTGLPLDGLLVKIDSDTPGYAENGEMYFSVLPLSHPFSKRILKINSKCLQLYPNRALYEYRIRVEKVKLDSDGVAQSDELILHNMSRDVSPKSILERVAHELNPLLSLE